MASLAELRLAKEHSMERYQEQLAWEAYQDDLMADLSNQSLWGSLTGDVMFITTLLATNNPKAAQAARTLGSESAKWITKFTGNIPYGTEIEDIEELQPGKFDKAVGEELIQTAQNESDVREMLDLVNLGVSGVSAISSVSEAMDYDATAGLPTYTDADFTEVTEGLVVEGGIVYDSAGFELAEHELDSLGVKLKDSAIGQTGGSELFERASWQADPILTETGAWWNPVNQEFVMPSLTEGIEPGGEVWHPYQSAWNLATTMMGQDTSSIESYLQQLTREEEEDDD